MRVRKPPYPALSPGALKDKKDRRDYRLCSITPAVEIPKQRFQLEEKFGVKYQDGRGSCTAHAQTHHKERQEGVLLSARFVMALTKELEGNKKYGAYTRNTFKVVNEHGSCEENLYPEPSPTMSWKEYVDTRYIPEECYANGKKHKSKSYWRVGNSIQAIREALVTYNNSVTLSMAWYKDFGARHKEGVLPIDISEDNYVGGHAVECTGFDDHERYLIVKNSYSERWGDDGFCYLPYDLFNAVVWDVWTSMDLPEVLPVDERYSQIRTWQTFLREKAMAFNPWLHNKIGRLPNNREIKGLAYGFWCWETVFLGKNGDLWLHMTKPEAIKRGLL